MAGLHGREAHADLWLAGLGCMAIVGRVAGAGCMASWCAAHGWLAWAAGRLVPSAWRREPHGCRRLHGWLEWTAWLAASPQRVPSVAVGREAKCAWLSPGNRRC